MVLHLKASLQILSPSWPSAGFGHFTVSLPMNKENLG
jgi:hypothetical protein